MCESTNAVDVRRQLGMLFREGRQLGVGRIARAEDKPGDRPVVGVGRGDDRLVGIFRILAHLLQSADDVDDRLLHLRADQEFQRDPSQRVRAFGRHLGDAFDALELLFLLDDDLLLDFLRTCSRPTRFDRDRGRLHLRRQLHGHPREGDPAEQCHQQHTDQHLGGIAYKEVN